MKIKATKEYRRKLKNSIKRGYQENDLNEVIEQIQKGTLKEKHKDHKWIGKFKNETEVRECHIKPDWLLLYARKKDEIILLSIGSHSDFKI